MKVAIAALGVLYLQGCAVHDRDQTLICTEVQRDFPVAIHSEIDILLVVDQSPSMSDEADLLSANLARFARVLQHIEGGVPSVHIGVVSADVTHGHGVLESTARVAGCAPPQGAFLSDIVYANGEREKNYTGTLAETLACMALLPATGSEIGQPLAAMKRALDGSNPENAGFLREHALLMVVFLTDKDDCSGGASFEDGSSAARVAWHCFQDGVVCDQDNATSGGKTNCAPRAEPRILDPLDHYRDFLSTLKPDPGRIIVSAVAARGNPVVRDGPSGPVLEAACHDRATGWPATRLGGFLGGFPLRNTWTDLCGEDWSDALAPIADRFADTLGAPCIRDIVDLDPARAGVQAECAVSRMRYVGADPDEGRVLSRCSSAEPPVAERPCWTIDSEDSCGPGYLAFEVLPGREYVPPGSFIRARCFAGCE